MKGLTVGVILRRVAFSEELVRYATERARKVAAAVSCRVEVVIQPCDRSLGADKPIFEVRVEATARGKATTLRHRDGDLFLGVRVALDSLHARLERTCRAG